jgi:hypothetical protein
MRKEDLQVLNFVIVLIGAVAAVSTVVILTWPKYATFRQEWHHSLELKQATHDKLLAEMAAEVDREKAKTVAEVSRIVGDALIGNELYLLYMWADAAGKNPNSVIYVPTHMHMPTVSGQDRLLRPAVFPPDDPAGTPGGSR